MQTNPDLEGMLKAFPGIEDSSTSARISLTPVDVDGKFGEIHKTTTLGENGIEDKTVVTSKCFDCGCIADREGFGTICFNHMEKLPRDVKRRDMMAGLLGRGRALYICNRHIINCQSCKTKIICVHCLKLKKGVPYCKTCSWLIFLGFRKKGVILCPSSPMQRRPLLR